MQMHWRQIYRALGKVNWAKSSHMLSLLKWKRCLRPLGLFSSFMSWTGDGFWRQAVAPCSRPKGLHLLWSRITAVPTRRYSASPPAEGLRSPGTSQRLLATQGFSQGSTPHSPLQPPTRAGSSSTGKPSPGHHVQGDAKHTAASPGELCARCLVIYWDCVHKNKIKTSICVHPTASHRGMHEILLNTSVLQVLAPCPYLQTYGRQQINPRKKQMFVVIFFENLRFSD